MWFRERNLMRKLNLTLVKDCHSGGGLLDHSLAHDLAITVKGKPNNIMTERPFGVWSLDNCT